MRNLSAVLAAFALLACTHTTTVASPPASEPGHPELATSPAQGLAPGAADTIAQALRQRGLLPDGPTSGKALEKALRTFQESQDLAATGFPDHETLRKLGIDPRTVDRTEKPPDAGG
jgi:hypothetical protein